MSEGPKMNALELFAGAGGFSVGLHMGGNIHTKWEIEHIPAAAQINKLNSPGTVVYIEDVSVCFDRATRQEGETDSTNGRVATEKDNLGQPVHAMPKKGEVFSLTAGFPCPGYSSLNRYPKPQDLQNTLICSVLSYVDYYRPKYVTLENIRNLLNHKVCFRFSNRQDIKLATVLTFSSLRQRGSWENGWSNEEWNKEVCILEICTFCPLLESNQPQVHLQSLDLDGVSGFVCGTPSCRIRHSPMPRTIDHLGCAFRL